MNVSLLLFQLHVNLGFIVEHVFCHILPYKGPIQRIHSPSVYNLIVLFLLIYVSLSSSDMSYSSSSLTVSSLCHRSRRRSRRSRRSRRRRRRRRRRRHQL